MKQKLTLSIDDKILKKAKAYSGKKEVSLSQLFEKTINLIDNERAVTINPAITALQDIFCMPGKKYNKADYYESKRK